MNKPINITQAKARLSELVTRASAGEEVIISRRGKPIAKLAQLPQQQPRVPGIARHWRLPPEAFEPLDPETQAIMEGEGTDGIGIWIGLPKDHSKP
jgi:antitoxin (DNA-binding transcriptional repressor) of toxin-antitoxin stability system